MPAFQSQIDNIRDANQAQQFRIAKIKEIENLTSRPLIVYAGNIKRGGFGAPNAFENSRGVSWARLFQEIQMIPISPPPEQQTPPQQSPR